MVTGARRFALLLAATLTAVSVAADICVTDDKQRQLCLEKPAQRIVALSPGVTELLFAAGAGEQVVAAVTFSDHPEPAKALPRIGSYDRFDMEALLAMQPDLLVGWISGNPTEQLEQLERMGLPLYYSELRAFEHVASTIERLGHLAGTDEASQKAASEFRAGINAIRERYADAAPVRLFYQIWANPLMTVNDEHLISEAGRLCGGVNAFGELPRLAPRIDTEAVLAADPEVIIAGGMGEDDPTWLDPWRRYKGLKAVRSDNLFFVPPSTLQRPTPRLLEGTALLCQHLETARGRR